MLSKEENELITRTGPGTPGGELLRRYWQPVGLAQELTDERPKKRVQIMGEELVLYRTAEGGYGLVGEHCAHRGTSLYYGCIEGSCIRCPYHGWLYDQNGKCMEQPFEPSNSLMRHTIRHPAYPVEELGGMLFTYMGPPDKQPLLPRWDVLVNPGVRQYTLRSPLNCNWLQAQENTADVTHTYFLHGHMSALKGIRNGDYYYRPFAQYGFQQFPWGLLKDWVCEGPKGGLGWGNLLMFPNMLRLSFSMHWRVPMDDTHTMIYFLQFTSQDAAGGRNEIEVIHAGGALNEQGEYPLQDFINQDTMAWETEGPIWDRTREHLGMSDAGIVLFRKMLLGQIEAVQRGEDPMCLVRDVEENEMIDLREWFREGDDVGRADAVGAPRRFRTAEEIFDDRHQIFEVPYGTARPQP